MLDIEIDERRLALAERTKMLKVLFGIANRLKCSRQEASRSGAPGVFDVALLAPQRLLILLLDIPYRLGAGT